CGAAAHRAARLECVGRTAGAASRARLRHVADAGGAAARRAARLEAARGRAARRERAVGAAALVALLADSAIDRPVAAERGERDRDEVPVARLRPARTDGIAADFAAGRRAAVLALPDGCLARVAPHGAVPGEAERVARGQAV